MIIYMATNMINGKSYIGQTVQSLSKRKRQHVWRALNNYDNIHFHNALKRYGKDGFNWEIIHDDITTIDFLNQLEIFYISYYDTFENGYNLTLGGGGSVGYNPSEYTKKKTSESLKGIKRDPFTKEHREKLSEARKGRFAGKNSPRYGVDHSKKSRQKISKALIGKHHSEESKKKIGDASRGKKNPGARPVIIDGKYFDTRKEAAEFVGVSPPLIRRRILHKTRWLNYSYANSADKAYNKR